MKGFGFIIIGILLIGIAALWFFTPVSELVMQKTMPSNMPAPSDDYASRSPNQSVKTVLGWAEIIVDGLNAAFGAAGLYFTIKGWRLRLQDKATAKEEA